MREGEAAGVLDEQAGIHKIGGELAGRVAGGAEGGGSGETDVEGGAGVGFDGGDEQVEEFIECRGGGVREIGAEGGERASGPGGDGSVEAARVFIRGERERSGGGLGRCSR